MYRLIRVMAGDLPVRGVTLALLGNDSDGALRLVGLLITWNIRFKVTKAKLQVWIFNPHMIELVRITKIDFGEIELVVFTLVNGGPPIIDDFCLPNLFNHMRSATRYISWKKFTANRQITKCVGYENYRVAGKVVAPSPLLGVIAHLIP